MGLSARQGTLVCPGDGLPVIKHVNVTMTEVEVVEKAVCEGACVGVGLAFAFFISLSAGLCWKMKFWHSECRHLTPQTLHPATTDD